MTEFWVICHLQRPLEVPEIIKDQPLKQPCTKDIGLSWGPDDT